MSNCKKVAEILDLIIDNEATEEDKEFFYSHIDRCVPCLDHFNIEKEVKEFIIGFLEKKCCSESFRKSLEDKLKELTKAK